MRLIALVTDAFGRNGGIAQYNRDFLTAQWATNAEVDIRVLPRFGRAADGSLPSRIAQLAPRPGKIRYGLAALWQALRWRPDVIFCGHINMAVMAGALAWLCGARLVIQTHGIDAWEAPRVSTRRAIERADLVLSVSRYTRARILNWTRLAPERVVVVPNTVADDFIPADRKTAREKFGVDAQQVLLSVTRLDARERYKGIDKMLRLLAEMRTALPDPLYLVSGEGDDRPRLEALAKELELSHVVRFLGHTPRSDLADLYRAADAFVLPSTGEGFGIVFLEAMACGTPAIGLAAGGASDPLADGALGHAMPDMTTERWAEAINSAFASDRDKVSIRVRQIFGREDFARLARDHIQALLAS